MTTHLLQTDFGKTASKPPDSHEVKQCAVIAAGAGCNGLIKQDTS
ncbi:MAG: hypothetical protein QX197_02300 [Methylococcaceae bacterium]